MWKFTITLCILSGFCANGLMADTILLRPGGELNSQTVDETNYTIHVEPGQLVSGTINIRAHNHHDPGAVVPVAATVTWGVRENQPWLVTGHITPGWHDLTVTVNKTAPTTPGVYYIMIANAGQFTAGDIMSATSWAYSGGEVWYDDNDVGWDWTCDEFQDAKDDGIATIIHLNGDGVYRPLDLGANWVAVCVGSNQQQASEWELLDGELNIPRIALTGEALNGYLYAIGGTAPPHNVSDAQDAVSKYDPNSDSWTLDNSMFTARHSLSSAVIDGWIYAVGGHVSNSRSENERYNGTSWESKASVYARSGPGVAAYDGELYVFGGNCYGTKLSRFDVYDPDTNSWRQEGDMPAATEPWRATTLGDRIYVLAGGNIDPKKVWCYNPVADTWDPNVPHMNVSRSQCELQAVRGRIYAIGGNDGSGATASVESWTPGEASWRIEPSMNIARTQFASAVIGHDIYVFGGSGVGGALGSTEVLREILLTLLSPNGGENLIAGDTKTITWTECFIIDPYVVLEFSSNAGMSWSVIDTTENTGSYVWTIPQVTSDQCLVRARDASDPSIYDTSDDAFTIYVCQGPVLGDVNNDCYFNIIDFALLSAKWLGCGNPLDPVCTINDGLVAHWTFNEGSGGIAYDASGNNNDGTINGATWVGEPNAVTGNALFFDGLDDFVDVPNDISLNPTDAITLTAWFEAGSFPSPGTYAWPSLVSKYTDGVGGYDLSVQKIYEGTPQITTSVFLVDLGPGGYITLQESPPTEVVLPGVLYFTAMTYDGSALTLYRAKEGDVAPSAISMSGSGSLATSQSNLNIAECPYNPGRYWNGLIDEVRIYNRALTSAEIEYLYQNP